MTLFHGAPQSDPSIFSESIGADPHAVELHLEHWASKARGVLEQAEKTLKESGFDPGRDPGTERILQAGTAKTGHCQGYPRGTGRRRPWHFGNRPQRLQGHQGVWSGKQGQKTARQRTSICYLSRQLIRGMPHGHRIRSN
jgi:hypothetical protein